MRLQPKGDILIMACAKDEGPYLLEWIAHYLALGADRFIVVTNDCSDGTDLMLDRLDELGLVRHLPNPTMVTKFEKPIQHVAIRYASLQREFRRANWRMVLDLDEFLNIRAGAGRFEDLFEVAGNFDAISFNQVVFGSGGIETIEDVQSPLIFNQRYQFEKNTPRRAARMYGIKTLSRNDNSLFSRVSNHVAMLNGRRKRDPVWLDGSGKPMHAEFLKRRSRSYPSFKLRKKESAGREVHKYPIDHGTHDLGYIHHYAVRSLASFIVQGRRGDAMVKKASRDLDYWKTFDRNEVEDRSLHAITQFAAGHLAELRADRLLGELHEAAVDLHRKWFRKLTKTPEVAELVSRCKAWTAAERDRF